MRDGSSAGRDAPAGSDPRPEAPAAGPEPPDRLGPFVAGRGLGGGAHVRVARHVSRPAAWRGGPALRIAAIGDLHMGEPWMPPARLEGLVEAVNALRPDLTVLLGDYVSHVFPVSRRCHPRDTARRLAALQAPLGVWAVLGNHDWRDHRATAFEGGRCEAWEALEAVGIPVLENRSAALTGPHGGGFRLVGLGSQRVLKRGGVWRGRDDLEAAFAEAPEGTPSLLLAHEPDVFPQARRAALTLSGHTHGGQVRLLGRAPWVPSRYRDRYAWGRFVDGARELIVTAGVGYSTAPVRFGAPAEIAWIDL
ncbi:MAG: metallophosphoesterase, partial [Pseudomonadota bacterium]